jgi:hypothetical protein
MKGKKRKGKSTKPGQLVRCGKLLAGEKERENNALLLKGLQRQQQYKKKQMHCTSSNTGCYLRLAQHDKYQPTRAAP